MLPVWNDREHDDPTANGQKIYNMTYKRCLKSYNICCSFWIAEGSLFITHSIPRKIT
jgi:hypothetical protein